jgi:hypothetical protein
MNAISSNQIPCSRQKNSLLAQKKFPAPALYFPCSRGV